MKRLLAEESGSSVIEFVSIALILLIPTLYLFATLFTIQSASFAAEGIARESARIMSEARDEGAARNYAAGVAAIAAHDLNVPSENIHLDISCSTPSCLDAEADIDVSVTIEQPLPLIPAFIRDRLGTSVTVDAHALGIANPYLERSR
ncbi:hypothetical protein [Bowdeniella massiliensis]|uniref:hypothetical protein n=1 Tax=Bowdeniella massiliensis TaxID=2932264 RepID=UPI0020287890|nr:hypothetical protein [Bowdeniella massiliensis]